MNISDLIDTATGERKYLNGEERKAFFEATTKQANDIKFYSRLLYYTGCRLSEGLELTPERFDYREKTVILRTLKQRKEKPVYRAVELPADYLEVLNDVYKIETQQETQRKKQQQIQKGKKVKLEPPIWNFTRRTAHNYIIKVMQQAGLTGAKATARGLRHSMGVMLVANKVPLNVVQKILGHSRIENTMIYAQVLGKERREMISRVW